jgi:hypothetical protein
MRPDPDPQHRKQYYIPRYKCRLFYAYLRQRLEPGPPAVPGDSGEDGVVQKASEQEERIVSLP